ncbi:FAD-dependent oxidoreductase [Arthrobacter pascens]
MMNLQTKYHPDDVAGVPLLWQGDVAVIGGGSAGSTAATAAARSGASTLLIESGGYLGGTGTRVLDTFYGFYAPGPANTRVVGGIGWEVCERLAAMGMSFERPNTYGAGTGVTYEPEALKLIWDDLLLASGAKTLLYGLVTAVISEDRRIVGVIVETKQGPRRVLAKVLIDSSGEGELAWRAGATLDNSEGLDKLQPATATFRVGGVADETASTKEIHSLIAKAVKSGEYALPRLEGSIHATNIPGVKHANMTRVSGKDLTDPWDLSWAEQEGRRQSWEYVRFLQDKVPGYSQSYLLHTSSRIGVRETRRLVGEYVLSGEDFFGGLSHSDDIARCGAPIEDHGTGAVTRWEYVGGISEPDDSTYGIPYGTLLPADTDGLLVAGRFFSATHEAHASARSIAQCTAMGQAAGTAAAMAADAGLEPRDIDRALLRARLKEAQAIV